MSASKLFNQFKMFGEVSDAFCEDCFDQIMSNEWVGIKCIPCLEFAHECLDNEWTLANNQGVQDEYKDLYLEQLTLVRYAQVDAMKNKLKENNIEI